MLKLFFSTYAVLVALAVNPASAQQHEAVLQKIEIPHAGVDIVLATARPGGPAIDLRGELDPGVFHIAGGRLLLTYDAATQVLNDVAALLTPAFISYAEHDATAAPVAVYVVPTGNALVSAQR
jgi:hypothetical protein